MVSGPQYGLFFMENQADPRRFETTRASSFSPTLDSTCNSPFFSVLGLRLRSKSSWLISEDFGPNFRLEE